MVTSEEAQTLQLQNKYSLIHTYLDHVMWSASDHCFSLAASSSLPYRVKCSGVTGVVIWCFIKITNCQLIVQRFPNS